MASSSEGRFVYYSWGEGIHTKELAFSVLSARAHGHCAHDAKIVIYTDRPDLYQNLPAEILQLPTIQFDKWREPTGYVYRAKIAILADALKRFSCPVIMMDGDTYFQRSPLKLLRRLAPGKSLMHVWESYLSDSPDPLYSTIPDKLRAKPVCDLSGRKLEIPHRFESFNSGVVGLHPADAPLLDEVAHLCDEIYLTTGVRTSEQLAFAYVLSRRTKMSMAWDVVYHYYTWRLSHPFESRVGKLLEQSASMPEKQRALWLYAHRPRCRFRRRVRVNVEHALRRLGYCRHIVVGSESW